MILYAVLLILPFVQEVTPLCGDHFVKLEDKCYYFSVEVSPSWDHAWALCKSLDPPSVLLSLDTIRKWHKIRSYLKAVNLKRTWWVGGTDVEEEGRWVWKALNEPFPFAEWCPGQPDNFGGDEDCLAVDYNDDVGVCWNDLHCTKHNATTHFICETV